MKTKPMYNDISTEEKIDNYLLGRMSDEDKRLFEAELERDTLLKEEYECQKQVANAVQKVSMREFLIKHAEERKQMKSYVPDLSVMLGGFFDKIKDYFNSGQRVVWAFASVAAMVVAVAGGVNYYSTVNTIRSEGMVAYANLTAPVARDGNQIDVLIEQAYAQIGQKEWVVAQSSIAEARAKINAAIQEESRTEEERYEQQILKLKEFDLDWYDAILLMKQGKIIKARRALEAIASSNSPYAETARDELEKLF